MNTLLNKVATSVSTVILFGIGIVMAGLGFAVVGTLALFALAGIGLSFLALPFISAAQSDEQMDEAAPDAAAAA